MGFTRDEIVEELLNSSSSINGGEMQLSFEDACVMIPVFLKNGYAACITGGDIGDKVRLAWVYAGSGYNPNWADNNEIIFATRELFDMLIWEEYDDKKEDKNE